MTTKKILLLVLTLGLLGGCETKPEAVSVKKPTAQMMGLALKNVKPNAATLIFDVEVDNPYPVGLPLTSLSYTLASDANTFTSVADELQTTVPANSKQTVSLPAKVNYRGMLKTLGVKPGSKISYKAELLLSVDAPGLGSVQLPLSNEGELALPKVRKKTKQVKPTPQVKETPQVEETRSPDVIFVPTPQEVVDKMLELAEVKKDDIVYDLGCGDGRIVVTAAQKYGCKATGYDIDPQRVKESLANVEKNNVGHLVTIEQKDIFTLDLSKANVVTLYLLPDLNVKLIPQLEKLKPGSRIVSHDFAMEGVQPDKVIEITTNDNNVEHKVYLWTAPLKKIERKGPAGAETESSQEPDQF
jgi:LEA14-like dessication related protein/precorrin-6B methylase 2